MEAIEATRLPQDPAIRAPRVPVKHRTPNLKMCQQNGHDAAIFEFDGFVKTDGSAELTLKNDGGWSPLPGPLGDKLRMPAFDGRLVVGGASAVEVTASVAMAGDVPLLPLGLATLTKHPRESDPKVKGA